MIVASSNKGYNINKIDGWKNTVMYIIMIQLKEVVMSLKQLTVNRIYQRVTIFQQMMSMMNLLPKVFQSRTKNQGVILEVICQNLVNKKIFKL